jgi:hypothetical protein
MAAWVLDHSYGPGDVASIVGLAVALIGFIVTILGVTKARSAAMQAARAALASQRRIRFVATVVDLTALVSELEMVKRQHRLGEWRQCLGTYAELRRKLIQVRAANPFLSSRDQAAVQALVRTLRQVEGIVERAVESATQLPPSQMNALLTRQIDGMVAMLARIAQQRQGAR